MAQYVVKPGDTLWGIAQKYLGNGARWGELGYSGDPRKMPVGTVINIPGGGGGSNSQPQQQQPQRELKTRTVRRKIGERQYYVPWQQTEFYIDPKKAEAEAEAEIERQGYFATILKEAQGDVERAKQLLEEDFARALETGGKEQEEFFQSLDLEVQQQEEAKARELEDRGLVTSEVGRQEQQVQEQKVAQTKTAAQRKFSDYFTGLSTNRKRTIEDKDEEIRRRKREIEAERAAAKQRIATQVENARKQRYLDERDAGRFTKYEDIYGDVQEQYWG